MKKLHIILIAVMLASVVITGIFLLLLPETIPADFIIDGTIDRFGSKYEYLLFPFAVLIVGAFALLCKFFEKRPSRIVKGILIAAIALTALITVYELLMLLNIAILEFSGI